MRCTAAQCNARCVSAHVPKENFQYVLHVVWGCSQAAGGVERSKDGPRPRGIARAQMCRCRPSAVLVGALWRARETRSVRQMLKLNPICAKAAAACLGLLLGFATPAWAQPEHTAAPEYSHPVPYTPGWECDYGYTERIGDCVVYEVPPNSHLNSRGDGWECLRGYRRVGQECAPIDVPPNGYLAEFAYGRGWECSRGFRPVDGECARVNVPAHGYLNDRGDDWSCERGYMRDRADCVPVVVPAHAHLSNRGDGWECNRPYRRRRDECLLD